MLQTPDLVSCHVCYLKSLSCDGLLMQTPQGLSHVRRKALREQLLHLPPKVRGGQVTLAEKQEDGEEGSKMWFLQTPDHLAALEPAPPHRIVLGPWRENYHFETTSCISERSNDLCHLCMLS